jgi:hypothetical protein
VYVWVGSKLSVGGVGFRGLWLGLVRGFMVVLTQGMMLMFLGVFLC